jgi:spore germination cell wall hydrolase CwlJ-like protein
MQIMSKIEKIFVGIIICILTYVCVWETIDITKQAKEYDIRHKLIQKEQKIIEKNSIKIAKVLNVECGNCPDVDKLLIGSSLLNRVDNKEFPNTLDGVIKQPNQYKTSKDYTEHDKNLAVCLLENHFRDCDVLYFYNPKSATDKAFLSQMKKKDLIVQTKHHIYK